MVVTGDTVSVPTRFSSVPVMTISPPLGEVAACAVAEGVGACCWTAWGLVGGADCVSVAD